MKIAAQVVVVALALVCIVLCVVLIFMAASNERMQTRLQNQQLALNTGILGQQGQTVVASILQEMNAAAVRNPAMRRLLEQHGYQVQAENAPGAATDSARGAPPRVAVTPGVEAGPTTTREP